MSFIGAPYPIVENSKGFLATQSGINQVKSDLLCLLLTNPGERVMLPTFGTPLRELIFEQNDAIVIERAREMISNSIKTWEPRVTIDQINITNGPGGINLADADMGQDVDYILGIQILFFDPENIKDIQELVFEVPLSNQGA
jgi:phage baseplate assembly protein W